MGIRPTCSPRGVTVKNWEFRYRGGVSIDFCPLLVQFKAFFTGTDSLGLKPKTSSPNMPMGDGRHPYELSTGNLWEYVPITWASCARARRVEPGTDLTRQVLCFAVPDFRSGWSGVTLRWTVGAWFPATEPDSSNRVTLLRSG